MDADIDLEQLSREVDTLCQQPEESAILPRMQKLEKRLVSIDLTKIAEYSKKIHDIGKGFNSMLAPMYIRDFIMAYDVTNVALSRVMQIDLEADALLKTAEAIAYLDNAKEHLRSREIKDSSEARKRYVPMDPDVQQTAILKAKTEAMTSFLRNKMIEFRFAHDAVKKIAYTNTDSGNEGMYT